MTDSGRLGDSAIGGLDGGFNRPIVQSPNRLPSDHLTSALWLTGIGVFLFIYLPLVVVILYSFHDATIVAWPFKPFTLRWFGVLAHDSAMLDAAGASLKLAIMATLIALGIGVPGAFVLDRLQFPGKDAFERLVLLPLILPGVITGVALLTFFSFIGLSLTSGYPLIPGWPVVLGHGAALTSIVVTQVYARLRRFDRARTVASKKGGARLQPGRGSSGHGNQYIPPRILSRPM